MTGAPLDPWFLMRGRTPARIALGRSGASLPTREVLDFALAHARARDAVHARLDKAGVASEISDLGLVVVELATEAADRAVYLRRPDLGRRLDGTSRERLCALAAGNDTGCDVALVIGDGLSATAVEKQARSVVAACLPGFQKLGLRLGPVAIVEGARVALGDEVGALLGARIVVVLIGERPGLSAADSLGAYVTFAPRPGRSDAERNCISNIRPEGLAPLPAARSLVWLVEAALAMQTTGVALKDRSEADSLPASKD
jgi:ethanolamine ammonia-lyase small subunit